MKEKGLTLVASCSTSLLALFGSKSLSFTCQGRGKYEYFVFDSGFHHLEILSTNLHLTAKQIPVFSQNTSLEILFRQFANSISQFV